MVRREGELLAWWMQTNTGRRLGLKVVEYFPARLHHAERLPPTGPALLVGNHTLFGADSFPLVPLLWQHTGRLPRFLAERNFWRVPGFGDLLEALGAVKGEPRTAVELLGRGEIVVVYPGGADESFKRSDEAYQLRWGARAGFARAAMRAGAPIVPVAAVGVDDLFEVPRREHLVGRRLFGSPRYDLPLPRTLRPRRVPLDYHLLDPIDTSGDPDAPAAVERVRAATQAALDQVLGPLRRPPYASPFTRMST